MSRSGSRKLRREDSKKSISFAAGWHRREETLKWLSEKFLFILPCFKNLEET